MRLWIGSSAWLLLVIVAQTGWSGEPAAPKVATPKLAPGVMVTIEPDLDVAQTVARHDMVELLAVDAKYDWAKQVPFRRDVWGLQFQFKPVRSLWVDMPREGGKLERKLIRYMVYAVHNPGKALRPVVAENGTFNAQPVDLPIRFFPKFLLEIPSLNKTYPDRAIPLALKQIQQREITDGPLFSTEELTGHELAVGATLWGVAMWEDVDPRLTYFSVYVEGLTNAYEWADEPDAYKAGAPLGTGRTLARRMLKLNFWRPGDEYTEHEDEVRYPAPGQVDYEWVYR